MILRIISAVLVTTLMGASGKVHSAQFSKDDLNAYLLRNPQPAFQRTLAVHYDTHQRRAFWIQAEDYALKFNLAPPQVGVEHWSTTNTELSRVRPGSMNIRVQTADQTVYQTALSPTQARFNIFRHGPHYYDVHVYDLIPATEEGRTLPLKGEIVFHCYPEKLYAEVRLHPTEPIPVQSAAIVWKLKTDARLDRFYAGEAGSAEAIQIPFRIQDPSAHRWVGMFTDQSALALLLPRPNGTQSLSLQKAPGGVRLAQVIDRYDSNSNTVEWNQGEIHSLYCRLAAARSPGLAGIKAAAALEANPLTDDEFQVGTNTEFKGYDPRTGYYTIGTRSGHPVSYYYEHPQYLATAPFTIHNDRTPRKIYVRHEDSLHADRLEAGVVTDPEGFAVPILVQGSKNFSGEDEEPFYYPGDEAYSESYFPLLLEPDESIALQSHHAFQNWGNHPLKQISSLQAWMPYYQMSVGVTETTCYVPFRFGGHPGIWIADLRGVSGSMWSSQPQFDNVGGHRYFHYRIGNQSHYLRYLRSRFTMTGPNMALWGMDYVTEGGEATASLTIFEPPQYDQTRNFTRMRIDFRQPLQISNPAENLRLVSIDTRTQRLRYEALGYTAENGAWTELDVARRNQYPQGVPLAKAHPLAALYRVKPESHQHGNNAILVRDFHGEVEGKSLDQLALGVEPIGDRDLQLYLTLPGGAVRFSPGDFIEVDLMWMPYGKTGEGAEAPLAARQHFGFDSPQVQVEVGQNLGQFPCRIRVNADQHARFSIQGGYSRIPILIEGLDTYRPPVLERRVQGAWQPVEMTAKGNEGHHAYLTPDYRFGFVFLVETVGNKIQFRVR